MFNKLVRTWVLTSCSALVVACGQAEISETTDPVTETIVEEPKLPKITGRNEFETWQFAADVYVLDAVGQSPNDEIDADQALLQELTGLTLIHRDMPVMTGDTVNSNLWIWGKEDEKVTLSIVRSCGATVGEFKSNLITLSSEPKLHSVEHTFENDHGCILTRIQGSLADQKVYLYAHNIRKE